MAGPVDRNPAAAPHRGSAAAAGPGVRVYVPADATAAAVGAEDTARAIAAEAARRGVALDLRRNGSRGMFWLEPFVEVQTAAGRVGYGPVTAADVPSLFDANFAGGGAHPRAHGAVETIPYLARQRRITFQRAGRIEPLSLDDYRATGGYGGLARALSLSREQVVREVTDAGLRGRGGAAFPAGIKWETVRTQNAAVKYVVCNADEGDSGTFADRLLMEADPFSLVEGMTIAGLAVGARLGYIYLRAEYPHAHRVLQAAIERARDADLLGDNVAGSGQSFDLEVRLGAGAYICGEETSLLESLEGRRGVVRFKPPLPAVAGLFGAPTLVNNVLTLASVPAILAAGAAAYAGLGSGRSRGTQPFQLAGNVRHGGLVEVPFGLTLGELLHDFGGGTASGRPIRAVQVGGPLGAWLPPSMFDTPLDYEAFAQRGAMLGHGGIVVFDDTVDMAKMARFAMEFCAIESCGKCTPCRIGSTRAVELIDRICDGRNDRTAGAAATSAREQNVELLQSLCDTMTHGSLCALGGLAPMPVLSALKHYPQDFGLRPGAPPARA
jgi:formate dehydrogenase iron-sulfur subunit